MTAPANAAPHDLIRARTTIGEAEIIVCTDGTARFDGGAMFGVVPKPLWSRRMEPDALNRIAIGLNCVVVRLGAKTVLIETGFGNKLTQKQKDLYAAQELLPASLAAAGIAPADIDIVINTHLHWDHCGWNSVFNEAGQPQPFFPNAEYVTHRGEVEHGRLQTERDRVSYVPANYEPMLATGQMRLIGHQQVKTGAEFGVCTGIWTECFPGHTANMLAVHIESNDEHACFISDLLPTTAHLDLAWGMGFDLDPLRVIAERKRFYARAVPGNWAVLFPHDHLNPIGHIQQDEHLRYTLACKPKI